MKNKKENNYQSTFNLLDAELAHDCRLTNEAKGLVLSLLADDKCGKIRKKDLAAICDLVFYGYLRIDNKGTYYIYPYGIMSEKEDDDSYIFVCSPKHNIVDINLDGEN